MPSLRQFNPSPRVSQVGYPPCEKPCRVILSEHSESNFFHRDPEWHFVPFDPRFARISTTLRMTRWKKRKAAAVAESRQGKEKRQPFRLPFKKWHPGREFAPSFSLRLAPALIRLPPWGSCRGATERVGSLREGAPTEWVRELACSQIQVKAAKSHEVLTHSPSVTAEPCHLPPGGRLLQPSPLGSETAFW